MKKLFLLTAIFLLGLMQIFLVHTNIVKADDATFTTEKAHFDITVNNDHTITVLETWTIHPNEPLEKIVHHFARKNEVNFTYNDKVYHQTKTNFFTDFIATATNGQKTIPISVEDDEEADLLHITLTTEDIDTSDTFTYTLSYKLSVPPTTFSSELDYIYIKLLPELWPTTIDMVSATIKIPKALSEEFFIYTATYKNKGMTPINWNNINSSDGTPTYTVESFNVPAKTTIVTFANVEPTYFSNEAGYVQNIKSDLIQLCLFMLGLTFVMWFLFGRDKKLTIIPRQSPPSGLDPLGVNGVITSELYQHTFGSQLLAWQELGFIRLIITKDGSAPLYQAEKLCDLPSNYSKEHHKLFSELFKDGKDTTVIDQYLDWPMILYLCRKIIRKSRRNIFFSKMSIILQFLLAFIYLICVVHAYGLVAPINVFSHHGALSSLTGWQVFFWAFAFLFTGITFTSTQRQSQKTTQILQILIALYSFYSFVSPIVTETSSGTNNHWLKYLFIISAWASAVFIFLQGKVSKQGITYTEETLGFCDYLKNNEVHTIKANHNTTLSTLLPYIYIVGINKDKIKELFLAVANQDQNHSIKEYPELIKYTSILLSMAPSGDMPDATSEK